MSWINAAREIVTKRSFQPVNVTTGKIVNDKKTMDEIYNYGECDENQLVDIDIPKDTVVLDLFTASGLVQVYDALNEKNQKKFGDLPILKAVNVMWKLVNKEKA